MCEVFHPLYGTGNTSKVVLEAQQFLQGDLLQEDAVWHVEQVAVGDVQTHQALECREGASVKVADVLVVGQLELQQVGQPFKRARRDEGDVVVAERERLE